jgi:hypothetical protein
MLYSARRILVRVLWKSTISGKMQLYTPKRKGMLLPTAHLYRVENAHPGKNYTLPSSFNLPEMPAMPSPVYSK